MMNSQKNSCVFLYCNYISNSCGDEHTIFDCGAYHGRTGLWAWQRYHVGQAREQCEYESEFCAADFGEIVEGGAGGNGDRKGGEVLAGEGNEGDFPLGDLPSGRCAESL